MSILSQIGVVFLIIFIVLVLIRSNRQLAEAAREGEHFVDEWALREMRKQELLAAEAAADRMRQIRNLPMEEEPEEEISEEEIMNEDAKVPDNIVSIHREPDVRITFIELDENRRPVRRIPVRRLPFTIGRDRGNDLVIDNLTVAKKHCRIIRKDHLVVMEDTGSRNKLAVGGTVAAQTVLKDHLCIGIGDKEFLVETASSEAISEEKYHREALRTGEVL